MYMKSGGKDAPAQHWLQDQRTFYAGKLRKYLIVFGGYFVGGIATFISIIVSGATRYHAVTASRCDCVISRWFSFCTLAAGSPGGQIA